MANFTAYSLGLLGLFILILRYLISRDRRILGFLILYIPLTVIVFSATLQAFFSDSLFPILSEFALVFITVGAPYFYHSTIQSPEIVFYRIKCFGVVYILLCLVAYFLLPFYYSLYLGGMAVGILYSTLSPFLFLKRNKIFEKKMKKEDRIFNITACMTAGFSALGAPFLYYFMSGGSKLSVNLYNPFYYMFIILPVLSYQCYLLIHKNVGENSPIEVSRYNFSPREHEVFLKLIEGKSYADIGQELFISLATVKTHTNRIYRKTGMKNKSELMNLFR